LKVEIIPRSGQKKGPEIKDLRTNGGNRGCVSSLLTVIFYECKKKMCVIESFLKKHCVFCLTYEKQAFYLSKIYFTQKENLGV